MKEAQRHEARPKDGQVLSPRPKRRWAQGRHLAGRRASHGRSDQAFGSRLPNHGGAAAQTPRAMAGWAAAAALAS